MNTPLWWRGGIKINRRYTIALLLSFIEIYSLVLEE
jgi:hypothetical protein